MMKSQTKNRDTRKLNEFASFPETHHMALAASLVFHIFNRGPRANQRARVRAEENDKRATRLTRVRSSASKSSRTACLPRPHAQGRRSPQPSIWRDIRRNLDSRWRRRSFVRGPCQALLLQGASSDIQHPATTHLRRWQHSRRSSFEGPTSI